MAGIKARLAGVPVLGTALRVQERYTADAADNFAASIGFFAFLSLFPLIAIAISVAGFVFRGDPAMIQQVAEGIEDAIPALEATTGGSDGSGSGVADALEDVRDGAGALLSIGTATLLFSGLRVVAGAQRASAVVFRREVPRGVAARLEQLLALVVLGLLAIAGAVLGGSLGVDPGSAASLVRSLLISGGTFLLDLLLFASAYKLLTPGDGPAWVTVLPGAVLAAAGWAALKLFGASYIGSQGGGVYAGIGGVVGLLVLFYLAGRLYVYGAELSAIVAHIDPPDLGGSGEADAPRPSPVPEEGDRAPLLGDAGRLVATAVGVGWAGTRVAAMLRRADDDTEE